VKRIAQAFGLACDALAVFLAIAVPLISLATLIG
jgi:hypothetical protein